MATMRIMRTSVWASYEASPLVTVVRDCDVIDTLESIRDHVEGPGDEGAFFIHDIFTMEDTDIVEATFAANERIDGEKERNMAVLYFWSKDMLNLVRPGGLLATEQHAPLPAEDVAYVLHRLHECDEYEQQTVAVVSEDSRTITMIEGEVNIDGRPA